MLNSTFSGDGNRINVLILYRTDKAISRVSIDVLFILRSIRILQGRSWKRRYTNQSE